MGFVRVIAGCATALMATAGCGTDKTAARRPMRPVTLQISTPVDSAIVREDTIEVQGRVTPQSARVQVLGRTAQVRDGTFSSVVSLSEGPNVIDVAATASGRSARLTAFRVIREQRVTVPDLKGETVDEAARTAQRLGLRLGSERGGGLFDSLLPGELAVCDQAPTAGSEVRRGTLVQIVVARSC